MSGGVGEGGWDEAMWSLHCQLKLLKLAKELCSHKPRAEIAVYRVFCEVFVGFWRYPWC